MKLPTVLRPQRDAEDVHSELDRNRAALAEQARVSRLAVARRQQNWTEIPQTRLVRRGRLLVDAESDAVYVLRRGVVFEPYSSTIGYLPPNAAMTFYVDESENIVFLEQPSGPQTWSELVARRARR